MPLVSAQTRGGGSLRLSFVSVDIALCVGPRKAGQSCVTASLASGFAFETTWVCALASLVASAFTVKACNIARRDMSDMAGIVHLWESDRVVGANPDCTGVRTELAHRIRSEGWACRAEAH